jgi:hypothetical protein
VTIHDSDTVDAIVRDALIAQRKKRTDFERASTDGSSGATTDLGGTARDAIRRSAQGEPRIALGSEALTVPQAVVSSRPP